MSNIARPGHRRAALRLRHRRTLATGLARRDEPSFVTREPPATLPLMRLLAVALLPDDDLALAGVERAERSLRSWRAEHGDRALDDGELRELLLAVRRRRSRSCSPAHGADLRTSPPASTPARSSRRCGISARTQLYCCGQPGNIDWDVVRGCASAGPRRAHAHTRPRCRFSLEQYEHKRATSLDLPLDAIGLANDLIDRSCPAASTCTASSTTPSRATTGRRRRARSVMTGPRSSGATTSFAAAAHGTELRRPARAERRRLPRPRARPLPPVRHRLPAVLAHPALRQRAPDPRLPVRGRAVDGLLAGSPPQERAAQTRWMAFVRGMGSELLADLEGIEEEGKHCGGLASGASTATKTPPASSTSTRST